MSQDCTARSKKTRSPRRVLVALGLCGVLGSSLMACDDSCKTASDCEVNQICVDGKCVRWDGDDTESGTEDTAATESESDSETGSGSETVTQTETETDTETETGTETGSATQTESETASETESATASETESATASETESETASETESETESETVSETETIDSDTADTDPVPCALNSGWPCVCDRPRLHCDDGSPCLTFGGATLGRCTRHCTDNGLEPCPPAPTTATAACQNVDLDSDPLAAPDARVCLLVGCATDADCPEQAPCTTMPWGGKWCLPTGEMDTDSETDTGFTTGCAGACALDVDDECTCHPLDYCGRSLDGQCDGYCVIGDVVDEMFHELDDCSTTCDGMCAADEYTACTCAANDPCGWSDNRRCDDACFGVVGTPFDDRAECPGPCDGDCFFASGRLYNECTCGSDDPCGWIEDATCDDLCDGVVTTPFDDTVDCL